MLTYTLFATLLTPAFADDPEPQAEEFLLADLGVRLDLPDDGWRMTRWSDWDFKAEYTNNLGKILLFAWATPVQIPIAGDGAGWGGTYTGKVEELSGKDPKVLATSVEEVGGRNVALVDTEFLFGADKASIYGASIEIAGQNMHLALLSSERNQAAAKQQRDQIVKRLDVRSVPLRTAFGSEVAAAGITSLLPKTWRPPFEEEIPIIVVPAMKKIGVEDLEGCWSAVRPMAGAPHGVMITCQGGLELGVVDEHSFGAVDQVLRDKLFGGVDIPPAEMVTLPDRVGFAYQATEELAVGIVPYDKGVARTWVLSSEGPLADLETVMSGSTFSGHHKVAPTDWITYYAVHRPTSPVSLGVLGGAVVVVLGLGALLVGRGSRNRYADFDED